MIMIINEDYFDTLDIKDEDIMPDVDVDDDMTNHIDPMTLLNSLHSGYSHYLIIEMIGKNCYYNIFSETADEWNYLSLALRHLSSLFDLYGIDYSEPIVTDGTSMRGIKYIVNYRNKYKVVTNYKTEQEVYDNRFEDYNCYVYVFFNLPKLNTYRRMCKFMGLMAKASIKHRKFNLTVFNNEEKHFRTIDADDIYTIFKRKTFDTAIKYINIFFPHFRVVQSDDAELIKAKMKKEKITKKELIEYFDLPIINT